MNIYHSISYKDPDTGVNTNSMQSHWRPSKAIIYRRRSLFPRYSVKIIFSKIVELTNLTPFMSFQSVLLGLSIVKTRQCRASYILNKLSSVAYFIRFVKYTCSQKLYTHKGQSLGNPDIGYLYKAKHRQGMHQGNDSLEIMFTMISGGPFVYDANTSLYQTSTDFTSITIVSR